MKLYATVTSERGGRPANKGGNELLNIAVSAGNKSLMLLHVHDAGDHWRIVHNYLDGSGAQLHSIPKTKKATT